MWGGEEEKKRRSLSSYVILSNCTVQLTSEDLLTCQAGHMFKYFPEKMPDTTSPNPLLLLHPHSPPEVLRACSERTLLTVGTVVSTQIMLRNVVKSWSKCIHSLQHAWVHSYSLFCLHFQVKERSESSLVFAKCGTSSHSIFSCESQPLNFSLAQTHLLKPFHVGQLQKHSINSHLAGAAWTHATCWISPCSHSTGIQEYQHCYHLVQRWRQIS